MKGRSVMKNSKIHCSTVAEKRHYSGKSYTEVAREAAVSRKKRPVKSPHVADDSDDIEADDAQADNEDER
jgi:hypothetical protein